MAAVEVLVETLVSLWRTPLARRSLPGVFVLLSLAGSALKELELVPSSYFSSSRNALNMYFVKVSWGWTLLLLTPFVLLSSASFSRSASFLARRLLSLVVATALWYVCTQTFFYIEDASGSCFDPNAAAAVDATKNKGAEPELFRSKSTCRRAGFHWDGYDISGHSFILSYSALLIMEEMAPMASVTTATGLSALPRTVLNLLYVALNTVVLLWVWMFACTSVYFHEPAQKWLGTTFGLLAWYLTYRVWYLKALSPGLPPQRHAKEKKQHA